MENNDKIEYIATARSNSSGAGKANDGFHKNIFKPTGWCYDMSSPKLSKANSAYIGVAGTKTSHKQNALELARTKKEDRSINPNKRGNRTVKNAMGKEVTVAKFKVVKAKDVPVTVKKRKARKPKSVKTGVPTTSIGIDLRKVLGKL